MQPIEVNQQTFADLLSITRQTVADWMANGMPHTKPGPGAVVIDLAEALPWVKTRWTSADDRDRLAKIKADDAQLDLDLKLKTLMKVSTAMTAWENTCAMMRARLLSIAPTAQTRLGLSIPQVLGLTSLVHEALEVLSGRIEAPAEDCADAPKVPKPTPKPLPAGQKRRGPKPRHS